MVEFVLQRLKDKDFNADIRKSYFVQEEVEYLGFLLTGVRPDPCEGITTMGQMCYTCCPWPKLCKISTIKKKKDLICHICSSFGATHLAN